VTKRERESFCVCVSTLGYTTLASVWADFLLGLGGGGKK